MPGYGAVDQAMTKHKATRQIAGHDRSRLTTLWLSVVISVF
jgi:hypothetical protein